MDGTPTPVDNEDDADENGGTVEDETAPEELVAISTPEIVNNETPVLLGEDEYIDTVENLSDVAMGG